MFRLVILLSVCVFSCVFFVGGLVTEARAQTVTDERVWFTLALQERGGPDHPWRWSMETILRSRDALDALDTLSLRPTAIYSFTPRSSVGVGYGFVASFPASGGTNIEHRVSGQYVWTGPVAGGTLTLRSRLEGRFIEGTSGALARVRQQVRFTHALTAGSRAAVVGYDELLLHLNTTTRSPRGVDQNRAFAGIANTFTPAIRMEIGYLNQFIPGHGAPDRMNHILSGVMVSTF